LEKQLHAWQPRLPAATVKARLFPERPPRREWVSLIRWFAPTAACGLIALAALRTDHHWPDPIRGVTSSGGFADNANSALNGVMINRSPDFFEWTNRSDSALNVRSFLPSTTN
jgi:hypothetical protein